MVIKHTTKLLLTLLLILPLLSIIPPAVFADPVVSGMGMQCKPELQKGRSDQMILSFYADYEDNGNTSRVDLFGQGLLSSVNSSVAEIDFDTGVVTAHDIGTTVISATYGGFSVQCQLDVTDLIIAPETMSLGIDETETYTATYVHPDGSTEDVTDVAVWSSTNPAIAIPAAANGQFKGIASGSTVIQASYKFGTASTNLGVLSVQPPSLVSVKVLPENPSIQVGEQQVFTATANYSDGTTQDVTNDVLSTWMVTNPMVAAGASTQGIYQGKAAGISMIGVCFEVACDSTNLTVVSLPIIPPTDPPPTVAPPTEPPIIVPPEPEPTPEPEKILGKVYGVVQDITGKPLKGVRVEIHSDPQTTFTDENGAYLFSGLPLGEHTVKLIDDDLKEIGKISVVVGDIEQDNKATRLVLSEEKAEAHVSFYIEPIVEEVVPEEPKQETPIVKEPVPTFEEKPEPKPEAVEEVEKPESPKVEKPVQAIQTVVPTPQTKPESKPISEPETIVTPKPVPSSEPIPSESPEPVLEPEPLPESLPIPQTDVPEYQKDRNLAVRAGIAAGIVTLIIVFFGTRKTMRIDLSVDGEAVASVKANTFKSKNISPNITNALNGKAGCIRVEITAAEASKAKGKTINLCYTNNGVSRIVFTHVITQNDTDNGFAKEFLL